MFNKVKKWLGIEGVKVELVLPEFAFEEVGAVSGKLRFFSKNAQTVERITLVMIERYGRGRGKNRLTDEYVLGEMTLEKRLDIPAEGEIEIGFTLPFQRARSPMDEFGEKNILSGGLSAAAKFLRNVKSEYRIEAEAKVEGVALSPFDRQAIGLR